MAGYKRKRPSYKKKATKKPFRKAVAKKRMTKIVKRVILNTTETAEQTVP